MDSKTVLILAHDPVNAALYMTFLDEGDTDCGFLAVTTAEEALDFCSEMIPDCLVVDDSVDVPKFLTTLAGSSGTLPCAVITVVGPGTLRHNETVLEPLTLQNENADRRP